MKDMKVIYLIIITLAFLGCSEKKLQKNTLNEISQKIKSDSLNSDLYFQRGKLLRQNGEANRDGEYILSSIKDYTKAIELDSSKSDYYMERSLAYADIGNFLNAIEDSKTASNFSKKDSPINFAMISRYYSLIGKYDSTLVYADKALKNENDENIKYVLIDKAHSFWYLGKYDKAIESINEFIKKDKNNKKYLDLLKLRSIMHEQSNNKRAALNDYLEIKLLNKNKTENLAFDFAIANKYIDLSKPDSAKIYWDKVKGFKKLEYQLFDNYADFSRTIYFEYDPEIISARIDSLFKNKSTN